MPTFLWWQEAVIYQVYPRSFQDSGGDGVGDLRGALARMPYLEWLGIDAIWISPFYPSPMVDFGYDVKDYVAVDPIFGDLADFDALVEEGHRRGIKIIIDFVINHTSSQHAWFVESRAARTAAKRDWYIWADSKPDGSPPNNWISLFGGPAWEWDAATQQWYLHSFDRSQPDLNWRNPAVQETMFDALRFWMERGVDGFRVDAAHMIMKDRLLRDNPPNREHIKVMPKQMGHDYEAQLHLYDKDDPDGHEIYRQLRQLLDAYSAGGQPRFAIGEIHTVEWSTWASYYGARLDELHMPLNLSLVSIPWEASAIRAGVEALEAALAPGAWPNYALGNHDEPRIVTRIGAAQARVAMLLLATLRGTPTLYYGEEIGMRDGVIPPELVMDPMEKNNPGIGLGRDPARTPMQWDTSANAGFCPSGSAPWLPIAPGFQQINVAVERDDPSSLLTLTRRLLELRRASPALRNGDYAPVEGAPQDCFVYRRERDGERYLVALNFAPREQTVELASLGGGRVVVSTHAGREGAVDLARLRLLADEGCVIALG